MGDLLELITTIELPGVKDFRPLDHFKEEKEWGAAKVRVSWLNESFRQLCDKGKIETDLTKLRIHKIIKRPNDSQIIAELGGDESAETNLAQMWQMIELQGRGQNGNLLIDLPNVFYIRSVSNVLCAAWATFSSEIFGWSFYAHPATMNSGGWDPGVQVISR